MEQHIIDIILAAVFIIITAKYFFRGFAKTVMKFIAFFMSIILAKSFSGQITDWIFSNTKLFMGTDRYIAKLIIMVLSFLVFGFLLDRLADIINGAFKLPVLKQANRLLGGVLGAVCGAIAVIILCVALQISSHVVYNSKYINTVENSVIVQTVLSDEKISSNIKALN